MFRRKCRNIQSSNRSPKVTSNSNSQCRGWKNAARICMNRNSFFWASLTFDVLQIALQNGLFSHMQNHTMKKRAQQPCNGASLNLAADSVFVLSIISKAISHQGLEQLWYWMPLKRYQKSSILLMLINWFRCNNRFSHKSKGNSRVH